MLSEHLQSIQSRSLKETKSIAQFLEKKSDYDLIELINAQLQHPVRLPSPKALDAVYEASAVCRQVTGDNASGVWVPLSALAAKRDLTTTGSSALVKAQLGSTLEETLRPVSAVVSAGATVFSGVRHGNLTLPAYNNVLNTASAWVAEGATAPAREPSFRQVTLAPKTLAVEIRITRQLLKNAGVDIEAELRREIFTQFMAEIDKASLNGTTASGAPDGLLVRGDTPVIPAGTNGAVPTWQHAVDLEHAVATANGRIKSGSFLTNAGVQRKLRTTQRAAGLDFILGAENNKILGYETYISQNVPSTLTKGTSVGNCSAILFGDFSDLIIAFWGPSALDLIVDGTTLIKDGIIRIVARADVGIAPRNVGSFCVMKDILTA